MLKIHRHLILVILMTLLLGRTINGDAAEIQRLDFLSGDNSEIFTFTGSSLTDFTVSYNRVLKTVYLESGTLTFTPEAIQSFQRISNSRFLESIKFHPEIGLMVLVLRSPAIISLGSQKTILKLQLEAPLVNRLFSLLPFELDHQQYLRAAFEAINKEHPDLAFQYLDLLSRLDPEQAEYPIRKAALYFDLGQEPQSLKQFERLQNYIRFIDDKKYQSLLNTVIAGGTQDLTFGLQALIDYTTEQCGLTMADISRADRGFFSGLLTSVQRFFGRIISSLGNFFLPVAFLIALAVFLILRATSAGLRPSWEQFEVDDLAETSNPTSKEVRSDDYSPPELRPDQLEDQFEPESDDPFSSIYKPDPEPEEIHLEGARTTGDQDEQDIPSLDHEFELDDLELTGDFFESSTGAATNSQNNDEFQDFLVKEDTAHEPERRDFDHAFPIENADLDPLSDLSLDNSRTPHRALIKPNPHVSRTFEVAEFVTGEESELPKQQPETLADDLASPQAPEPEESKPAPELPPVSKNSGPTAQQPPSNPQAFILEQIKAGRSELEIARALGIGRDEVKMVSHFANLKGGSQENE